MNFFSKLFGAKPASKLTRRVLNVETVRMLLKNAIHGHVQSNYRDIWTKARMATVTQADVEEASLKSYLPWKRDAWECEDQARSLIDAAQRKAASEGMTWAIGTMHADGRSGVPDGPRHVYVWAVISSSIAIFDPGARQWCELPDNIYFSIA